MPILLFVLAAVLYSIGGVFMKQSLGLTRLQPSLALFGCFCAGAACQALGMRQRDMGATYVLVLGLEAVVAVSLGTLLLGERLNLVRLGAMAVILIGVAVLERS